MGKNINFEELFGMEPEEAEGSENKEESADPQEADFEEGENDQEGAEPDRTDDEEKPREQSDAENAAYAAARRKAEAERDAEIARIKAKAEAEKQEAIAEIYRKMKLIDPHTGKLITNSAEYEAYAARSSERQKAEFLEQSGMTEQEYNRFVESLPEVQEARRKAAEAAALAEKANAAEAEARIQEQLKEIQKLDESMKTLEDLAKMEAYEAFYGLVQKGYSMVDAYKLTNFDKLTQKAAGAEKQKALNLVNSKTHLEGTKARGEGAITVPAEVKVNYRIFMPKATDAEIEAHYRAYRKR